VSSVIEKRIDVGAEISGTREVCTKEAVIEDIELLMELGFVFDLLKELGRMQLRCKVGGMTGFVFFELEDVGEAF
jgi:hypothetical protein